MCMPREPEVLGQPVSPMSSSTPFAASVTSRTCDHGTPGIGSRSIRSSSGWSRSSLRTGCGLRSMQPRLTTQASWAASRTTISSAVRGRSLLEEGLPLGPVDKALERHRALGDAPQGALGDGQVVVQQVALGVPGKREEDLVRVADLDLAARYPHRRPPVIRAPEAA